MSGAGLLPAGFESLEPFVATWARDTANERMQARLNSSESDRLAVFNAARDLVPKALALLDAKPFDQYDEKEDRLMKLVLGVAHAALAVEVLGETEPFHAQYARHITITRASADCNP